VPRYDHSSLDEFTLAYIEAMLWSTNDESTPSGGRPLDENYGIDDLDDSTLAQIRADCEAFQRDNQENLQTIYYAGWRESQAGHLFWMTQDDLGTGFQDEYRGPDRALTVAFECLTDAAHALGEFEVYVGDDGRIYASGYEPQTGPTCPTCKTPLAMGVGGFYCPVCHWVRP